MLFPPLTCESAPEDTSTLRTWEKARPVILFWWPLSLVLTCQNGAYAIWILLPAYQRKESQNISIKEYLINPNIIYLDGRVLHAYGNDIIVLRMECQKCCCWWRGHKCCHGLHVKKQKNKYNPRKVTENLAAGNCIKTKIRQRMHILKQIHVHAGTKMQRSYLPWRSSYWIGRLSHLKLT